MKPFVVIAALMVCAASASANGYARAQRQVFAAPPVYAPQLAASGCYGAQQQFAPGGCYGVQQQQFIPQGVYGGQVFVPRQRVFAAPVYAPQTFAAPVYAPVLQPQVFRQRTLSIGRGGFLFRQQSFGY